MHFCARNGDSWGLALLLAHAVEPTEALRIHNKEGRDVWNYMTSPLLKLQVALKTAWILVRISQSLKAAGAA